MKMTSDSTLQARQKYGIVSFGIRLSDSRSGDIFTAIKILLNKHTGWTVELQLLSTFRGISDI